MRRKPSATRYMRRATSADPARPARFVAAIWMPHISAKAPKGSAPRGRVLPPASVNAPSAATAAALATAHAAAACPNVRTLTGFHLALQKEGHALAHQSCVDCSATAAFGSPQARGTARVLRGIHG